MTLPTSLRSHPDFTEADETEIAEVERHLFRRLRMLSDDSDLIVVSGMAAAGLVDSSVVTRLTTGAERAGRPLDLAAHGIPAAEFSRFQQLWYHFKVPYARASLVWWYLFCLALGRDGDVTEALRRMTHWLGALGDDVKAALTRIGDVLDLPGDTVVVTDAETRDLDALTTAVRLGAPFLAVADIPAAKEAGRVVGRMVVTATPAAGSAREPVHPLWLGPVPALRDLPALARAAWQRLPEQERDELLATFERRISSIERVRLLVGETLLDNRGVVAEAAACRKEDVAEWPEQRLVLATLLWCWHQAGFVLQELNQSLLSFPALALFLLRKTREYAARLPDGGPAADLADGDLIALARHLGTLRTRVEKDYERCLHFDGSNWERREFLLPLSVYRRRQSIPESLCAHLHAELGVEPPGRTGALHEWDRFLELALEAGSSPTRVMQELAHWAANAQDLRVDLAIFTVPLGRKLDEPWTMEFTDLFCYTGFRYGFRPEDFGIAANRVVMYNVIAQRMRYNAVKKAQNYAPVMRFAPQGFNLPDIAVAEDANHGGHAAAGIRLACRLPITIAHHGTDWNGLADVRLNRATYSRENRFRPSDMIVGYRYTQWAKGIADATYRRGLGFDEKWSDKVKDLDI